jgi:hypothetical protein
MIVAPSLLRSVLTWPVRAVWLALLAISPVLVYLSRTARPYALDCLFAFIAIVAFDRWQAGRKQGWAVAYVLATVAAAWLHILTIVFTLWPFVWFGLAALWKTRRGSTREAGVRDVVRMIVLALATISGLALVLAPPISNDWRAMAAKAGAGEINFDTLYRSALMTFGISAAWLCVVLALLFAIGAWRLGRREPRFTAYIGSLMLVGTIVIALSRPAWVQHQQTFVRYVLPIVPFVLMFVAEGIVFVVAQLRIHAVACAGAMLALIGLVAAGPLPGYYHFPNQFMGHELFQFDFASAANPYATRLDLGPVPAFYRDLATRPPGSITLIETPARLISHYLPDPWYQAIHRQNVKFALAAPFCSSEADEFASTATGVRFRRIGRLADVVEGANLGADYLVLRMRPWSVPPGLENPWPDMAACASKVTERLGAPVYSDEQIVVFALGKEPRLSH